MAMGPRKLAVATAPGQQYGNATAQADAQKAVPMASGPLPAADPTQAAQQFAPPPVVPIGQPTLNPNEHVTTGMNAGIGPTVPTQAGLSQSPVLKGVALLNALGDAASPDTRAIRDALTASQGNEAAP
jgi:hypothetical protein